MGWLGIMLLTKLFCFGGVCGLEWDTLPDNLIYACAGSRVTLPWHFKEADAETVVSINWIHDGALASSIVATMVHDHFLPTSDYTARVQHVANGGLVLEDLFVEDSGNYTVEVNVAVGGQYQSIRQSAYLQVGDGAMLQGGQLKAEQEPEAWWDESSRQWFIRLTCGTFTFLASPPFDVDWTTPSGEIKSSSGYESARFYLSIATPVQGGNYTCSVPPVRLPDLCYKQDGDQALSAAVAVDEMKARLSLLEANQKTLREDNARLHDKLQSVEETHVQDMQNMQNVTGYWQELLHKVEEKLDDLQSVQQSFMDRKEVLRNKTHQALETGPCLTGEHKEIDDAWRSTTEAQSGSHCDRNLQVGWYRFFLEGRNAVIPTECVEKKHCHTFAPQWLDLKGHPMPEIGEEVEARACAHWTSGCCHWESSIIVRNCGAYFVYKLQPSSDCSLAYCVEPQK